jgi:hypothetical protein
MISLRLMHEAQAPRTTAWPKPQDKDKEKVWFSRLGLI